MRLGPSDIVASLPATTPFRPPEAIEREMGHPFRLRLGANESSFGASPQAIQAATRALSRGQNYPDCTYHDLRHVLSTRIGCSASEVLVGPGIDGLLGHLLRAWVNPGDAVVTSLGSYPTLEYAAAGIGGVVHRADYANDRPDVEALATLAIRHRAKVVYLANPDNPSGALTPLAEVRFLRDQLPEDVLLLLDEAYHEFAEGELLPDLPLAPHVVRLRTFSKVYGMAGSRIAYALGGTELLEPINRFRMHFEVSSIAVAAAMAALEDQAFVHHVVNETSRGRIEYADLGASLGLGTLPSHTNFVCFDVGGRDAAVRTMTQLAHRGVFVRMPWAEPLDRCIRVSVGTEPERATFADLLASSLASSQ